MSVDIKLMTDPELKNMSETPSDILSGYRLDSATYTGSYGSCRSGETIQLYMLGSVARAVPAFYELASIMLIIYLDIILVCFSHCNVL